MADQDLVTVTPMTSVSYYTKAAVDEEINKAFNFNAFDTVLMPEVKSKTLLQRYQELLKLNKKDKLAEVLENTNKFLNEHINQDKD